MTEARIRVMDDNPTNLKLICDLLDWARYQVAKARGTKQALELIGQWPPGLC